MEHLDIILPSVLLSLTFILKLTISKSIKEMSFIESLCELPVDIDFLALSYIAGLTIEKHIDVEVGIVSCFILIGVIAFVITLWRYSVEYFLKKKIQWIPILGLNIFVSIYSVILTIDFLNENRIPDTIRFVEFISK